MGIPGPPGPERPGVEYALGAGGKASAAGTGVEGVPERLCPMSSAEISEDLR